MSEPGGDRQRLGIAVRDLPPDAVAAIAHRAERAGFTDLLIPETGQLLRDPVDGRDPFLLSSWALDATEHLRAGPGIVGTVFRSARHTAIAAATVNERSGGRFIAGVGVSHRSLAEPLGMPFPRSPLEHAASYCDELRQLSSEGLAFGRGFPVMLAARGDRMLGVAAAHADGTLLTWTTIAEAIRVRGVVDAASSSSTVVGLLIRVGEAASLHADAEYYGDELPGYAEHFTRQGLRSKQEVARSACIELSSGDEVAAAIERYREAGVDLPCVYPSRMSLPSILDLLDDWPVMTP